MIKSMKRTFVILDKKPVEKNKEFIKALFESHIPKARYWFDKLDCRVSWARETDSGMTLEKYLENFGDGAMVRLDIRREIPEEKIIIFSALNRFPDAPSIERFVWYECPLNKRNYEKVSKLFKKVYGHCMGDTKL